MIAADRLPIAPEAALLAAGREHDRVDLEGTDSKLFADPPETVTVAHPIDVGNVVTGALRFRCGRHEWAY